jgi:hypothetical protein
VKAIRLARLTAHAMSREIVPVADVVATGNLDQLDAGDVLLVTRLDRLARSTRDLLNTLAAIANRKAGFRSLGDAWADTTTAHGCLMLTVLGGLAEFERDLISARAPARRHGRGGESPRASGARSISVCGRA